MSVTPDLELRPEVRWFAEQMERRLRAKDAERGGNSWKDADPGSLFAHLEQETIELARLMPPADLQRLGVGAEYATAAYTGTASSGGSYDVDAIVREAADVANLAMMLADVARHDAEYGE